MIFDTVSKQNAKPSGAFLSRCSQRGMAHDIFEKVVAFTSRTAMPERILGESYEESDPEVLITILSYLANLETFDTIFTDAIKVRALELLSHEEEGVRAQAINTFVSHGNAEECLQLVTRILESDVSYEDKLTAIEHLSLIDNPQRCLALRHSLAKLANDLDGDPFLRNAAVERLMEYGLVCD